MLSALGKYTYQGSLFDYSEDAILVDYKKNLFGVFDGMGGPDKGDIAAHQVASDIQSFYTKISGDIEATKPFFFDPTLSLEVNSLVNAVQFAHYNLWQKNKDKSIPLRGLVSGICLIENKGNIALLAIGAMVGLVYRKNQLEKVIEGKTFYYHSAEFTGSVPIPKECIGHQDDLNVLLMDAKCFAGDIWILMPLATWGQLTPNAIAQILKSPARALDKAKNLISESSKMGVLVNQSCLILQYGES